MSSSGSSSRAAGEALAYGVRLEGALAAACALAITLGAARDARGNGRYPASTQVVFSADPSDPDLVVVRTTFGLLEARRPQAGEAIGADAGTPAWRWLCESALGVPLVSIEDPSIALTANGSLVVGLVEGLEVSPDLGCTIACAAGPLGGQPIVDLASRANAPHAVVALSSGYVFGDAGVAVAQDTRVWQSADDGAHWSQLGAPLDPTVQVTTLDVAPSDPARLYVTGTRGFDAARTSSLFVSTDTGATWTERPLPFDANVDVADYIAAVDPLSADRVYVRSSGTSRLLVTDDAGRTFRTALTFVGPMQGFALAPDGSRVYAGGPEDGIAEGAPGADGGLAFTKIATTPVTCLATRGAELWACTDTAGGFAVATARDGGAWSPEVVFADIAGPIACAPGASIRACDGADASACGAPAFDQLCGTIGGCADAGPDGGGDPDPMLPYRTTGCFWCAAAGAHAPGASAGAGGLAGVGLLWAVRSARRRRRPRSGIAQK